MAPGIDSEGDVSRNEWIDWAECCWSDIRETNTLNVKEARSEEDTRHICPLQLDVIDRLVRLYTNPGEIVFFDRSLYNRAVVEPVMGFCSKKDHQRFLQQVTEFEHMLYEDGVIIIKFWFSISKEEQAKRFEARRQNPLKQWKLSPVDEKAQELWDSYTRYKEEMFSKTHATFSPWIIVKANDKQSARLESLRYVLNLLPYKGKDESQIRLTPDPNIITRFHRKMVELDL